MLSGIILLSTWRVKILHVQKKIYEYSFDEKQLPIAMKYLNFICESVSDNVKYLGPADEVDASRR